MKIFKRIYYPVLAALAVLMLVLGLVDARVATKGGDLAASKIDAAYSYAAEINKNGPANSYKETALETVRDYITTELIKADAESVTGNLLDEEGKNLVDYAMSGDKKLPSLYVQETKLTGESFGDGDIAAERTVRNVILAFPGTSDDAVLLYAPYDTSALGGASDAAATGALLASAVDALNSKLAPENTVVYLFGDAGSEGDLGALAFVKQFAGFDNVAEKVRAVAEFRSCGTDGTLMTYGEKDGSLAIISEYASHNGSAFTSSALPVMLGRENGVFGEYSSLTFTNRGGFDKYATANDTEVDKSLVSQYVNAMNRFTECFGSASVADMNKDGNAVYFSYLDVLTVSYSNVWAYVIAAVIAALVIATVIVNLRTKAFSWGKALAGAAVQLVTLLATALASLALYYVFALLLCGFGVLPFQGLSSIRFAGSGLLISASIMAVALAIFFYIILKRTFAVKAGDVVRGNVVLFALTACILSFALPAVSYPFTCVALFGMLALLASAIFKSKFRAKFGMDMDRLFLYACAIVFSLPLFMPLFFVAQTVYPLVSIVLVLALIVALAGFVSPYADYLKPALDKVFKKLPMRTIRVERTVTEKVEDKAKKGKFTEVTVKKVEKEKVAWSYLNRMGIVAVMIISAVMIMLFSSFNTKFSSSALDAPSYYDDIYDDSLLYVYDGSSVSVEVHDRVAYEYIRYAVPGLEWNADKNAYVKSVTNKITDIGNGNEPAIGDKSGNTVSFTSFDMEKSQIIITLENASEVTKVSFGADGQEYEFDNRETITFRLPYGYNLTSMDIEGGCRVVYEQHIYNENILPAKETDDWQILNSYANEDMTPRAGVVIKLSKSL